MDFVLLALGFLTLVKGADLLVAGSASIAARFGVSALVVGLTVVSFGTSLPEMLVTTVAAFRDNADLAIGNLLGSNIANVLLVLGIAAMIRPLPVRNSTVVSEIPFSLIAALLVGFLANAALFSNSGALTIGRLDGAILLFFFLLFMMYVFKIALENRGQETTPAYSLTSLRSSAYILIGVVLLYFGGQWVVDGAVGIAGVLGVSDAVIGLTIVAVGTSAPELVASAVAAYRGQTDIAVGNIVGSNIFNLLWVLGFTASLVQLPFDVINNDDIVMVIGSSSLLILALAAGTQNTVRRGHGIFFVLCYCLYIGYVVQR